MGPKVATSVFSANQPNSTHAMAIQVAALIFCSTERPLPTVSFECGAVWQHSRTRGRFTENYKRHSAGTLGVRNQVMYTWHRTVVVGAFVMGMAACATVEDKKWFQEAKTTSSKAVTVASEQTSRAFKRTQHYLAEKDLLKTFQDASEHS